MKIAIIGPGALGCLLAAFLEQTGERVFLVDYRPERAAALEERGISFTDLEGREKTVKVQAGLPEAVAPCDLTILAVKAHQTRSAAAALPGLMGAGGLALTLQNGLGNVEEMARAAGPERLLAGVTFMGVTKSAEGAVIHAGAGPTYVGPGPGSQVTPEEVAVVVDLFRRAGLECKARDDIETVLWEKLLVNVAINPLTALLRVPNGALPELPDAWGVAAAAAAEARAVAGAAGITLGGDFEARLRQVCAATARNRSSMLQDVLAGRPTEIEALNGQVAARGAARGVPTPVNDLLTRLLRAWGKSANIRVG